MLNEEILQHTFLAWALVKTAQKKHLHLKFFQRSSTYSLMKVIKLLFAYPQNFKCKMQTVIH